MTPLLAMEVPTRLVHLSPGALHWLVLKRAGHQDRPAKRLN